MKKLISLFLLVSFAVSSATYDKHLIAIFMR